jgi:hypothetical protein
MKEILDEIESKFIERCKAQDIKFKSKKFYIVKY